MNGLTMKHLRYFEALARLGHFGRAAEACAVTQPALSMQIKELEALIGAPLVERSARQIRLTALDAALDAAAACKGVPTVILADTVKGKGVSFMEGKAAWHGKAIPDAEFAQAMQELGGNV